MRMLASVSNSIINLLCDFGQRSPPEVIFQPTTVLFDSLNSTKQLPDWLCLAVSLLCLVLPTQQEWYKHSLRRELGNNLRSLFQTPGSRMSSTGDPAMVPAHPHFLSPPRKSFACLAKFWLLRKTFHHLHVISCFLTKPYGSRVCNSGITRPAQREICFGSIPKGGQLNVPQSVLPQPINDWLYRDSLHLPGCTANHGCGDRNNKLLSVPYTFPTPTSLFHSPPTLKQVQWFILEQLSNEDQFFLGKHINI